MERTPEQRENLRKNLRHIRMFKRLSGGILSKDLKMAEGTLWSHEYSGKVSDKNLKKYAEYYKIPFEDFDLPSEEFQKKYCYRVASHILAVARDFIEKNCLDEEGNSRCKNCNYVCPIWLYEYQKKEGRKNLV